MLSDLWAKINYTSDISYVNNVFIYELDISKANINILYEANVIDKNTYDYLYNAERMVRQVYVGKLQRDDPKVIKILQAGIIEAKKKLFEANSIQDFEVLAIKNDAVFMINRIPSIKDFGLVHFVSKNIYTGFYKIKNLEFFYYYNSITKEENLDIKGIRDSYIDDHRNYLYEFFKDLFYTLQCNGIEIAIRMMKDFYMQYISRNLSIEYYRRFGINNDYHFKNTTIFGSGYYIDNATDQMKNMLDISYNLNILLELQQILTDIYFSKHK